MTTHTRTRTARIELRIAHAQVKAANPNMPTTIYLDAELAEPFQTSVLAAMKDPSMADFFLRDKDGNHMTCTVFCRSM